MHTRDHSPTPPKKFPAVLWFNAKAMANDPADRPTASELLQHPFITTAEESKFDLAGTSVSRVMSGCELMMHVCVDTAFTLPPPSVRVPA